MEERDRQRRYDWDLMMVQQEAQRQLEAEQRRHELDLERTRLEIMNLQYERPDGIPRTRVKEYKGPKIPSYKEGSDIDVYLRTFEKLASVHGWERGTWATRLAAVLAGKGLEAYSRVPPEDSEDFDKVKQAILKKFELTPEAYRKKFRDTKKGEEPYAEYAVLLTGFLDHWIEGEECGDDFSKLKDLFIREQILDSAPLEHRLWLKDKNPKSVEELVTLADHYVATHGKKPAPKGKTQHKEHKEKDENSTPKGTSQSSREPIRCFKCGKLGHIAVRCRTKREPTTGTEEKGEEKKSGLRVHDTKTRRAKSADRKDEVCTRRPGKVDGKSVTTRDDSGCDFTLVKSVLMDPENYDGDFRTLMMADGRKVTVPTAVVLLEGTRITRKGNKVPFSGSYRVGVMEGLPEDVLLGTDLDEPAEVLVCTRAQAKAKQHKEKRAEEVQQDEGVRSKEVLLQFSGAEESACEMPDGTEDIQAIFQGFDSDTGDCHKPESDVVAPTVVQAEEVVLEDSPLSIQATDKFGCRDRLESNNSGNTARKDICMMTLEDICKIGPDGLHQMQLEDSTLSRARDNAYRTFEEGHMEERTFFYWKDDLLYRFWSPSKREEGSVLDRHQLVVPRTCRESILKLSHDVPLSGHLGVEKTKARILKLFYWPGIFKDVSAFCRSCGPCQRHSRKMFKDKAPLIPVPLVEEPFSKIAIDILGPLPRSRMGNKYILVLCDYATKYPEAIPMGSMESERVAEALFEFFSKFGIPREIQSDQGTNFVSAVMKHVYRLLGINKLTATPYHPEASGLVERLNSTILSMLRKYVHEEPEQWDKYLPYLLFAYREVPQESTGFSPFEMVFGRHVRGPLNLIHETWTGDIVPEENVAEYVLKMRQRIQDMSELAQTNMARSQKRQKLYYDRKARGQTFKAGDKVLVLLPSGTNKLLCGWQGPFKVLRRVNQVNYEICMGNKRKRKVIFHANMLKLWKDRENIAFIVKESEGSDEDTGEGDTLLFAELQQTEDLSDVHISEDLINEQRQQMMDLLAEFEDILTDVPGHTSIIQHNVVTTEETPIRQKPYRLPEALKGTVKSQLADLEKAGLIQASKSAWASPIVLAPKKDNTYRLCVDYRRLNAITRFDPYPIPRTDEFIERLGQAKYITSIDLSKGYCQIQLSKDAREKTRPL